MFHEIGLALEGLRRRISALEANDRAEVTGGVQASAFAALPTAGSPGRIMFCTNCRKMGEGVGVGTGTNVYSDAGASWRRFSDDSAAAV